MTISESLVIPTQGSQESPTVIWDSPGLSGLADVFFEMLAAFQEQRQNLESVGGQSSAAEDTLMQANLPDESLSVIKPRPELKVVFQPPVLLVNSGELNVSFGGMESKPLTDGVSAVVENNTVVLLDENGVDIVPKTEMLKAVVRDEGANVTSSTADFRPVSGIEAFVQSASPVTGDTTSGLKEALVSINKPDVETVTVRNVGDVTIRSIRHLLGSNEESIRIRLVPRSLGELNIAVTTTGGSIEIVVSSASATVREVLDEQIFGLRDILQREGVDVSNVKVEAPSKLDMGSFQSQSNQRSNEGSGFSGTRSSDEVLEDTSDDGMLSETGNDHKEREHGDTHDGDLNVFV